MNSAPDPVWRSYLAIKIRKLRSALSPLQPVAAEYVFSIYRAVVGAFLDWVDSNASRLAMEVECRQLLECLDDLALYTRFYESAALLERPSPLVEHVQLVFGGYESSTTILLRPQNAQTFETRTTPYSVRGQLTDLAYRLPQSWLPDDFVRRLETLPNIYVVSYPKYLGDVFLFYPLVGHELGHVLYEENATLDGLTLTLSQASLEGWAERKLAVRWAVELFCDLVGAHLYGESYLYSLWLFLQRFPNAFGFPRFAEYERRASASSHTYLATIMQDVRTATPAKLQERLDQATIKLLDLLRPEIADSDVMRGGDTTLWQAYPSPGARLRLLADGIAPLGIRGARRFTRWRANFLEQARAFSDNFPDYQYATILDVARMIARRLYEEVKGDLIKPTEPRPSQDTSELLKRLAGWIPPCEVGGRDGLQPAPWRLIILAGWARFVELSLSDDLTERGKDWPLGWIGFVYQSLDMNSLYRTYREAKKNSRG